MNEKDKESLNTVKTDTVQLNEKYTFIFKKNFQGFGWSHNFEEQGVWSEGNASFLLFKLPKLDKKVEVILEIQPYISNKNKDHSLEILINNNLKKKINFFNNRGTRIYRLSNI